MGERHPDDNQLEAMLADYQRLKEENAALRRLLVESGIVIPAQPKTASPAVPFKPPVGDAAVDEHLSKHTKIALFRSLFRGREDVYAVRTQFKSGDWGYVLPRSVIGSRSCRWTLPFARRSTKRPGNFLPLTDHVVRQHLEGKKTIGVYPLLLDEACWFLAVDFDKRAGKMTQRHSWKHAVN